MKTWHEYWKPLVRLFDDPKPELNLLDNPEYKRKVRKSLAKMQWNISMAEPEEYYECGGGNQCSFTKEIIDNSKSFVLDQEKNNSDWSEWVEEWKK